MTSGVPETRYARSGELFIAYQAFGEGPPLVLVPGFVWNVEHQWDWPEWAAFARRLASFSQLIVFDKRGTGLSDRVAPGEAPTLEDRIDDLRAVLDAVGVERATLLGNWEGGPMSALFAASCPERTSGLILYAAPVVFRSDDDYPWAPDAAGIEQVAEIFARDWGKGNLRFLLCPSIAREPRIARWFGKLERLGASPGAAIALSRMNAEIDIRPVLPTIRVPTLVLHRREDPANPVEAGRYVAARIPGARFVELEGCDHLAWVGDVDSVVGEIEEFVTGARSGGDIDRVLATILFADIVDSTGRAETLGDRAWGEVLGGFRTGARERVERFRGRIVDTSGDGFLATFDGPARAVRCAAEMRSWAASIGLDLRHGLHTGECELSGDRVAGIAVHIGARIAALAAPGEVLTSSTVRDLVAGSGLVFEDRGAHELKGVSGQWRLHVLRSV